MKVKIKTRNKDIKIPEIKKWGDVGLDLEAIDVKKSGNWFFPLYTYSTGIALEIPDGYWVLLTPRSSLSKKLMWLANHVGIVDTSYTGELVFKFRSILGISPYKIGERIGQMILMKKYKVEFVQVDKVKVTERGNKGFGSTGK